MQPVDATPRWIIMFATVCVIVVLIRLANGHRAGLALLLAIGIGIGLMFMTYSVRHAPPAPAMRAVVINGGVEIAKPVVAVTTVSKPARPKRLTKEGPPGAPSAPKSPPAPTAEAPVAEAPAVTVVQDPAAPATAVPSDAPEAPFTIYQGSSTTGRPVDKLPGWVTELADAKLGSSVAAFSSDRFASIKDAEAELWIKAQDFVARDLRMRAPEASEWWPPADLLKSHGFIVERCVERTTLEVGQFVEPMYRVHWKTSLSKNVRDSIADAWRPTVQAGRLKGVTLGFLCATGALAFLNIILRSVAAQLAARKTPTPTQVA